MKKYIVYHSNGFTEINADRIERHSTDDTPTKILFIKKEIIGDHIVAEFYPDKIFGWAEVEE